MEAKHRITSYNVCYTKLLRIRLEVEHLDEMGDLCRKFLYVELMGKHSNIIFCDEQNVVIDSIKRVSTMVSSVREVLPGREYFIPDTQEKRIPLHEEKENFIRTISEKSFMLYKALYSSYMGISPLVITSYSIHYTKLYDSAGARSPMTPSPAISRWTICPRCMPM